MRWRPTARTALTVTVLAAALGASACGGTSSRSRTVTAPGVPQAAVRVIVGWSTALREGRLAAAARLFRLPSLFDDGSGSPVELQTLAQALAVNAALPCGATFLSAHLDGSYVNALFRLGNRAGRGGGCGSGTGQTARTNFLIRSGRIVAWVRAPDEPGDNGGSTHPPGQPSPPAPANPTSTQPPAKV